MITKTTANLLLALQTVKLDGQPLSPTHRMLMVVLANQEAINTARQAKGQRPFYPSNQKLADNVGYTGKFSKKHLSALVVEMERGGLLTVYRSQDSLGQNNYNVINLDPFWFKFERSLQEKAREVEAKEMNIMQTLAGEPEVTTDDLENQFAKIMEAGNDTGRKSATK